MAIGFRVFLKRDLPPPDLLEAYRELSVACVADCMSRSCALSYDIRLMTRPSRPMVGAALTVKTRDGDNLMMHKAFDMAGPGDVVLVANEGGRNRSLMGALGIWYLKSRGAAGLVVDGPIRDIDDLGDLDLPVYATGLTPGGPYKDGPGEINVPVSCGGISINPGDIVLGDADGVIIIPLRDAPGLLDAARAFAATDAAKLPVSKKGENDRSWVDKALEQKKCEILDRRYNDA